MSHATWIGAFILSSLFWTGSLYSQAKNRNPVDPQKCLDLLANEYEKGKRFLRVVIVDEKEKEKTVVAQFSRRGSSPFRNVGKDKRIYQVRFAPMRFLNSPGYQSLSYDGLAAERKSHWAHCEGYRHWIKEVKTLDDDEIWKLAKFGNPQNKIVEEKDGTLSVAGMKINFVRDDFLKGFRQFQNSGHGVQISDGKNTTTLWATQGREVSLGVLLTKLSWESKKPVVNYNRSTGVLERHLVFTTTETDGKKTVSRQGYVLLDKSNRPTAIKFASTYEKFPKK